MRFIAILVLVLAYGPAIFDLAVTGRAVNRPTRTSTTDWALAQFYTLHTGKPSLAILPTGLGGAVLTGSDHGHNNQDFNVDSTISIWTIYLLTTRGALANIGTFGSNFNRRRLDRQWRYIRGWWQSNSGRVIDEGLVVYIYSLVLLTGMSTIWRKRATEDLARFIGRQLLPVGVPATCVGVVTVSEELHSGQEQVPGAPTASSEIISVSNAHNSGPKGPNSRRIIVITLLVFQGGFVIIHYEAVNDRVFWTVTIILSPGPSGSSAVSRRVDNIHRVVPRRTVTLPTRGLIEAGPPVVRQGGEPLPSHEQVAQPNVSPRRRPGSTSSSFTTIHSLEGVLVMASSFIGEDLHWSIQFYPFQHYHISHPTDNGHEKEELVRADVDIPLPVSPEFHGLGRSTRSLELHQSIAAFSHQYLSLRAMLVRPLLPEEAKAIRAELRPRLRSLGRRAEERHNLASFTSAAMELEGQVNEEEVVEQVYEEEVDGQVYAEEVDAQVNEEEIDAQVNEEEVDGQVNAEEVEVSPKWKRPHCGGKKSRTRKHKHEMNKEEEAGATREY